MNQIIFDKKVILLKRQTKTCLLTVFSNGEKFGPHSGRNITMFRIQIFFKYKCLQIFRPLYFEYNFYIVIIYWNEMPFRNMKDKNL